MKYKIKLNKGLSLRDKETQREVVLMKDIWSLPVSESAFKYIKENHSEKIISVEPIDLDQAQLFIPEPNQPLTLTQSQTETNKKNSVKINIKNITKKEPENKKNESIDLVMDIEGINFDISDEEIENLINMEEDFDRIYINGNEKNNDEKKSNIDEKDNNVKNSIPETDTKTKNETKENVEESEKNNPSNETQDDDYDIDSVLDFFTDD